jgi:formate-dependent nitrite reductase cytochrome c552 subunit
MDDPLLTDPQKPRDWSPLLLRASVVLFGGLAAAFLFDLWGHPEPLASIPLVDPAFLDTATVRRSYSGLVRAKEDLSDFDCYACHEKNKPPVLRYDAQQKLIIPQEHSDIVMGHGEHGRNNNCFNCHNESNLTLLQPRDGRPLTFADSTPLCGSCHGPTYRDWEAGAHGRISGYWNRALGPFNRQDCVNCHNPHSPKFPPRKPAPGPHLLHEPALVPGGPSLDGHA